jgi:hypothetical protein
MESKELKSKIKNILANMLGVEMADINDDDDFSADLQMEPITIADFQEKLTNSGVDAEDIDFNEVSTISDLLDALEGVAPQTSESDT